MILFFFNNNVKKKNLKEDLLNLKSDWDRKTLLRINNLAIITIRTIRLLIRLLFYIDILAWSHILFFSHKFRFLKFCNHVQYISLYVHTCTLFKHLFLSGHIVQFIMKAKAIPVPVISLLDDFRSQNNGWHKMSVQVTSSLNQASTVGKNFAYFLCVNSKNILIHIEMKPWLESHI